MNRGKFSRERWRKAFWEKLFPDGESEIPLMGQRVRSGQEPVRRQRA